MSYSTPLDVWLILSRQVSRYVQSFSHRKIHFSTHFTNYLHHLGRRLSTQNWNKDKKRSVRSELGMILMVCLVYERGLFFVENNDFFVI
jgi:hypothetical protein